MLYKYLDPERIDVLEFNHIRFTPPEDFNDPFELKPVFSSAPLVLALDELIAGDFSEAIKAELAKFPAHLQSQCNVSEIQEVVRSLYTNEFGRIEENFFEHLISLSGVFTEKTNEMVGLLSLAEKNDNLLMWSHYARSHKGFCIGFDRRARFFNRKRTESDEFYHLRKVQYSSGRPALSLTDVSGIELFFTKSLDWRYEQEWRMCALLGDSQKIIPVGSKAIHLFEFPNTIVKEVILGACMDKEAKDKLLSVLREKYQHVDIKEAKVSPTDFKLDFCDL